MKDDIPQCEAQSDVSTDMSEEQVLSENAEDTSKEECSYQAIDPGEYKRTLWVHGATNTEVLYKVPNSYNPRGNVLDFLIIIVVCEAIRNFDE